MVMGLEEMARATYHAGDVHDVANFGGADERDGVHAACQQMPSTSHTACCNIGALLHPPHDLDIPESSHG